MTTGATGEAILVTDSPATRGTGQGWLRPALTAVLGVALVLFGGGLALALGIGRDEVPTVDSVDAGFARDMSGHHVQGVEIANLALERSTDPEIRLIAFDISSTQTNQAGRMQGWLALWGIPVSGGKTMSWMGERSMSVEDMSGGLMPGMATEGELTDLRGRTGRDFDVTFLQLMIRHHQGGRDMAGYAAEQADEAAVRTLAGTIADTQAAEVTTMTDMLAARGGTSLPAP